MRYFAPLTLSASLVLATTTPLAADEDCGTICRPVAGDPPSYSETECLVYCAEVGWTRAKELSQSSAQRWALLNELEKEAPARAGEPRGTHRIGLKRPGSVRPLSGAF